MKYTIRFAMIVALCTLAVLAAIPTTAGAQIIPNWKAAPTVKAPAQTPLPPPDLGDPNPKPPVCGWTAKGYRCSL